MYINDLEVALLCRIGLPHPLQGRALGRQCPNVTRLDSQGGIKGFQGILVLLHGYQALAAVDPCIRVLIIQVYGLVECSQGLVCPLDLG